MKISDKLPSGVKLLILVQFIHLINALCHDSFYESGNKLYVWSDNKANANTARQSCFNVGGKLVETASSSLKTTLLIQMQEKYNKGLQTVKIYQKQANENVYKYRSAGHVDKEDITNWKTPTRGKLIRLNLFSSPTANFTQKIIFCFYSWRDSLRPKECANDWKDNFQLYGGTSSTPGTITLKHVINNQSDAVSSRLLLPGDPMPPSSSNSNPPFYYIPDDSVFIGARSDKNHSTWHLSNKTRTTEDSYPPSSPEKCEQMSWPLIYDNTINLLPKRCDSELSYFVCELKFNVYLSSVKCNSSVLELSWSYANFDEILEKTPNMTIEVELVEAQDNKRIASLRFSSSTYRITNLLQRTRYTVKATLSESGCSGIKLTSTTHNTTSYGLPDPVTFATVVSSKEETKNCVVEWKHNSSDLHIIAYTIIANSTKSSKVYRIMVPRDIEIIFNVTSNLISYNVDLMSFEFNTTVKVKIQSESCNGKGEVSNVIGYCVSPLQPEDVLPAGSVNSAAVASSVVLISILILIVALLLYRKRKSEPSHVTVASLSGNTSSGASKSHGAPVNCEGDVESSTKNCALSKPDRNDEGMSHAVFQSAEACSLQDEPAYENTIYENCNTPKKLCSKTQFENNYFQDKENNFPKLRAEFKEIQRLSLETEAEHVEASCLQNKKKNRYKNIYPYDHARVILGGGNFINASKIQDFTGNKEYIATQGPKACTLMDFWEMIWNENTTIVVMLCNCFEKKKTKCEQYWPTAELPAEFGMFSIKSIEEKKNGDIVQRLLRVINVNTEEQREVTQFHYIAWPDHGVPTTTSAMMQLQNLVNVEIHNKQNCGPVVIHCSAGAGRTGTYIAFKNCVEEIEATGNMNVFEAVMKMRKNRKDMVQTENQYIFIHKLLLENIILPVSEIHVNELSNVMSQDDWEEMLSKEYDYFSLLESGIQCKSEPDVYVNEHLSNDLHQVRINSENSGKVIKMHAHYITAPHFSGTFIASSSPQPGKEADFWQMVVQTNTRIVVALESTSDDILTSFEKRDGATIRFGNILIFVDHVTETSCVVVQNLTVSLEDSAQPETKVTHLFSDPFSGHWNDTLTPPNASHFVEIVSEVKSASEKNDRATTIVYCMDGRSRTGIFFAVANLIEEIKYGNKIDVLRTVKDLKDMRPGMIESLDLYRSCYLLIKDYIDMYLAKENIK